MMLLLSDLTETLKRVSQHEDATARGAHGVVVRLESPKISAQKREAPTNEVRCGHFSCVGLIETKSNTNQLFYRTIRN